MRLRDFVLGLIVRYDLCGAGTLARDLAQRKFAKRRDRPRPANQRPGLESTGWALWEL
jgi:hypothetical protein